MTSYFLVYHKFSMLLVIQISLFLSSIPMISAQADRILHVTTTGDELSSGYLKLCLTSINNFVFNVKTDYEARLLLISKNEFGQTYELTVTSETYCLNTSNVDRINQTVTCNKCSVNCIQQKFWIKWDSNYVTVGQVAELTRISINIVDRIAFLHSIGTPGSGNTGIWEFKLPTIVPIIDARLPIFGNVSEKTLCAIMPCAESPLQVLDTKSCNKYTDLQPTCNQPAVYVNPDCTSRSNTGCSRSVITIKACFPPAGNTDCSFCEIRMINIPVCQQDVDQPQQIEIATGTSCDINWSQYIAIIQYQIQDVYTSDVNATTVFKTSTSGRVTPNNLLETQYMTTADTKVLDNIGIAVGVSLAVLLAVSSAAVLLFLRRRLKLNKNGNGRTISSSALDYSVNQDITISDAGNSADYTELKTRVNSHTYQDLKQKSFPPKIYENS